MNIPQWIMQVPVLSTEHIKPNTSEFLMSCRHGDAPWGQEVLKLDGGWLFFVGAGEVDIYPEDLKEVFLWAVTHNYEWIRLDESGDIVEGLPTYDW